MASSEAGSDWRGVHAAGLLSGADSRAGSMMTHSRAEARKRSRDREVCKSGAVGRGELQQLEEGLVDGSTAVRCCVPGCRRRSGAVPQGLLAACGRSVSFVRAMSPTQVWRRALLDTRHPVPEGYDSSWREEGLFRSLAAGMHALRLGSRAPGFVCLSSAPSCSSAGYGWQSNKPCCCDAWRRSVLSCCVSAGGSYLYEAGLWGSAYHYQPVTRQGYTARKHEPWRATDVDGRLRRPALSVLILLHKGQVPVGLSAVIEAPTGSKILPADACAGILHFDIRRLL